MSSEGTVASANPGGGGCRRGVLGWNVARRMLADVFEALELDAPSEEKEKEKEKGRSKTPRPGRRDEGRSGRKVPRDGSLGPTTTTVTTTRGR